MTDAVFKQLMHARELAIIDRRRVPLRQLFLLCMAQHLQFRDAPLWFFYDLFQ